MIGYSNVSPFGLRFKTPPHGGVFHDLYNGRMPLSDALNIDLLPPDTQRALTGHWLQWSPSRMENPDIFATQLDDILESASLNISRSHAFLSMMQWLARKDSPLFPWSTWINVWAYQIQHMDPAAATQAFLDTSEWLVHIPTPATRSHIAGMTFNILKANTLHPQQPEHLQALAYSALGIIASVAPTHQLEWRYHEYAGRLLQNQTGASFVKVVLTSKLPHDLKLAFLQHSVKGHWWPACGAIIRPLWSMWPLEKQLNKLPFRRDNPEHNQDLVRTVFPQAEAIIHAVNTSDIWSANPTNWRLLQALRTAILPQAIETSYAVPSMDVSL